MAAETALFGGLQLFAIGIIGEYIARLHFRTMGKPPYVIRDEVDNRTEIMRPPELKATEKTRRTLH